MKVSRYNRHLLWPFLMARGAARNPGEMIVWIKEMYVPKPRMSERIEQLYK